MIHTITRYNVVLAIRVEEKEFALYAAPCSIVIVVPRPICHRSMARWNVHSTYVTMAEVVRKVLAWGLFRKVHIQRPNRTEYIPI